MLNQSLHAVKAHVRKGRLMLVHLSHWGMFHHAVHAKIQGTTSISRNSIHRLKLSSLGTRLAAFLRSTVRTVSLDSSLVSLLYFNFRSCATLPLYMYTDQAVLRGCFEHSRTVMVSVKFVLWRTVKADCFSIPAKKLT